MLLSKTLLALADERRLKIVQILHKNGALTIRELAELLGEVEDAHSPNLYRVMRSVDTLSEAGIVDVVGKFPYRAALIPGVVEEAGRKLAEMDF